MRVDVGTRKREQPNKRDRARISLLSVSRGADARTLSLFLSLSLSLSLSLRARGHRIRLCVSCIPIHGYNAVECSDLRLTLNDIFRVCADLTQKQRAAVLVEIGKHVSQIAFKKHDNCTRVFFKTNDDDTSSVAEIKSNAHVATNTWDKSGE